MSNRDKRTLTIGRTSLHTVVQTGTAEGVPLLLCNGIGAPLQALQPFVDALEPAITTIRFDVPGVGASAAPPTPLPYPVLARLAGRLVRQLGHDRFDVLGISWGGGLAQQIAFQHPRRCRRLVLAATGTGSLMVPASPRVLRHMVTPARYYDPQYGLSVAGTIYGGAVRANPDLAKILVGPSTRPPSRKGYLFQLGSAAGWTSLPFLPLIRQQTLVLAGEDDPIMPLVNAKIMSRLLPHARLHIYDDGHLALVTRPAELAAVVSRFLLRSESALY